MTVYCIAQLRFTDRAAYDRYQAGFMAAFRGSGGRVLAADEAPAVLEGEWPFQKAVLIEFADEQAARAWSESPAYQAIAADRRAGATGPVLLIRGFGRSA